MHKRNMRCKILKMLHSSPPIRSTACQDSAFGNGKIAGFGRPHSISACRRAQAISFANKTKMLCKPIATATSWEELRRNGHSHHKRVLNWRTTLTSTTSPTSFCPHKKTSATIATCSTPRAPFYRTTSPIFSPPTKDLPSLSVATICATIS